MIALSVAALALLVSLVAAGGALVVSRRGPGVQAAPYDDTAVRQALDSLVEALDSHRAATEALQHDHENLKLAVAEGIQNAARAEKRIRAVVRRARSELEEHGVRSPGLEAEALDLFDGDAEGVGEGTVQPVPSQVASPDLTDIPGSWEPEDLALLKGP